MDKLALHQTVQCKNEDTRWLSGVVTGLLDEGRLLITVEGWPMALEFEEVRLPQQPEASPQASYFDASSNLPSSSYGTVASSGRVQLPPRRRRFARRRRAYRPRMRYRRQARRPQYIFALQAPASADTVGRHVSKTSEALEVGYCRCCEQPEWLAYTHEKCHLCGLINTTSTRKELRTVQQQGLNKPWRAPHKSNRKKLTRKYKNAKKRGNRDDKAWKRSLAAERKYKAVKLNRALGERHTYVLFD